MDGKSDDGHDGHHHDIELVNFHPEGENSHLLPGLITCYQFVFADPPWSEWKLCHTCKNLWGVEHKRDLEERGYRCCGAPVEEFWPRDVVEGNVITELNSDSPSCTLAVKGSQVIGFCWGYASTLPNLEGELGIEFTNALQDKFEHCERVAYQSEMGILQRFRGRGLATRMFRERLLLFLYQNLTIGVVRTRQSPSPSVTFSWFTQKLEYQVVTQYPGNDGRVILAKDLQDLQRFFD